MSCVPGVTAPRPVANLSHQAARDGARVTYVSRRHGSRWSHNEMDRLSERLKSRVFPGEGHDKPHVLAVLGRFSAEEVTAVLGFKNFEHLEVFQGLDDNRAPFPIDSRVWPFEVL